MDWIDDIVLGLIDVHGTNDPYELCDLMGITIEKVDPEFTLLSGCKSSYYRNLCDSEIIFIRNDLDTEFEKFYLRHEIGHAILHVNISNSLNQKLLNRGQYEKQANYFAMKLSQVRFDEDELYQLSLEQISNQIKIPFHVLQQLVNL